MPYNVIIKFEKLIDRYTIQELKELKEILQKYQNKTIEVELHKTNEKK